MQAEVQTRLYEDSSIQDGSKIVHAENIRKLPATIHNSVESKIIKDDSESGYVADEHSNSMKNMEEDSSCV